MGLGQGLPGGLAPSKATLGVPTEAFLSVTLDPLWGHFLPSATVEIGLLYVPSLTPRSKLSSFSSLSSQILI